MTGLVFLAALVALLAHPSDVDGKSPARAAFASWAVVVVAMIVGLVVLAVMR